MNVDQKPTDDAAEIGRLKDELAKANAECDKWITKWQEARQQYQNEFRDKAYFQQKFEQTFNMLQRVICK